MAGIKIHFFFQAEDGIRDIGVTGVQTCALPIWIHFVVLMGGQLRFGMQRTASDDAICRGGRVVEIQSASNSLAGPRSPSEIGERRVGKECRSRWSPYH